MKVSLLLMRIVEMSVCFHNFKDFLRIGGEIRSNADSALRSKLARQAFYKARFDQPSLMMPFFGPRIRKIDEYFADFTFTEQNRNFFAGIAIGDPNVLQVKSGPCV